MAYSLRQRLTLWAGVLTSGLLLATWLLATQGSQSYADHQFESILRTVSKELLEEMEPRDSAHEDFPEMTEEINEAAAQTSERLVVLHVRGDQVLERSHPDGPNWPGQSDRDWKLVVLPFHGDQLVAAIYFGDEQDDLNRQALLLGLVSALVTVLTIAGSWHLVGAVLSPIRLLSQQAQEADSNLQTRLSAPSNDGEMKDLVNTLNQFLDRISESTAARSRFYASASHELRTPLQALSGHLELALNKERPAAEYKVALLEAQAQSQRLIRLTQDLLTLNRLEGAPSLKAEKLDLVDYCELEWMHLKALAEQRKLAVTLDLPESVEVSAAASYLSILCRNLFENAVKYGKEGGRLEISVQISQGVPLLTVYNDCEALAPESYEKLLEPFYRPDPSRHSLTGGNGLGLAIVNAVVQLQSWQLRILPSEQGFRAEVHFLESAPFVTGRIRAGAENEVQI